MMTAALVKSRCAIIVASAAMAAGAVAAKNNKLCLENGLASKFLCYHCNIFLFIASSIIAVSEEVALFTKTFLSE